MMKQENDNSIEQEIGRAEKIHIYVSGILWLTVILLIVGFVLYVSIGMAMLD